jgi:hypothetical protein
LERTIEREMQKVEISWKEAKGLALDITKWKIFVKVLFHIGTKREKETV